MTKTPRPDRPAPGRFDKLPEPIDPEALITSVDVVQVAPEKIDEQREVDWLLRTVG